MERAKCRVMDIVGRRCIETYLENLAKLRVESTRQTLN